MKGFITRVITDDQFIKLKDFYDNAHNFIKEFDAESYVKTDSTKKIFGMSLIGPSYDIEAIKLAAPLGVYIIDFRAISGKFHAEPDKTLENVGDILELYKASSNGVVNLGDSLAKTFNYVQESE